MSYGMFGSDIVKKITEAENKTEYPCDICCKSDVCSIQESVKTSIDQIMDVCKNAESHIAVKPYCKSFYKEKETKTK